MKRFILSASIVLLGLSAIAPAALAGNRRQASNPNEVSEAATFHDLIRYNRDARSKG